MTTAPSESKRLSASILGAGLIRIYDECFSKVGKVALKQLVMKISIAGFAAHLGFIFLARSMSHPSLLVGAVGTNYLGGGLDSLQLQPVRRSVDPDRSLARINHAITCQSV